MITSILTLVSLFPNPTLPFFKARRVHDNSLAFNEYIKSSGPEKILDPQAQINHGPAIELYVSGRTLFTKQNSWTNIQIRSRNLSGTGCQSRINFSRGSEYKTKFSYAPPGTRWGAWNSVAQGLNGEAFSMSISELCDTGPIQHQVKYWPRQR